MVLRSLSKIQKVGYQLFVFFIVFDHANACASMHLLVEIHNTWPCLSCALFDKLWARFDCEQVEDCINIIVVDGLITIHKIIWKLSNNFLNSYNLSELNPINYLIIFVGSIEPWMCNLYNQWAKIYYKMAYFTLSFDLSKRNNSLWKNDLLFMRETEINKNLGHNLLSFPGFSIKTE